MRRVCLGSFQDHGRITGPLRNLMFLWHTCQKAFQDMLWGSEGSFMSETGRVATGRKESGIRAFYWQIAQSRRQKDRTVSL